MTLTVEQIALSTAEEERNYFTGDLSPTPFSASAEAAMPVGVYRVIDGEVFRIVPGPIPTLPTSEPRS